MKKTTLNAIATVLSAVEFENKENVLAEITAELNKGADVKAAKNAEYESVKDTILNALTDTPATIAEIYENISADLPEGFTRNKVQYAVTKLYKDEVVKHEGKPCTYTKRA